MADGLSTYSVPVRNTSIGQRAAFAESTAQGHTVLHLDHHGPASQEIVFITRKLLELWA